VKLTKEDIQKYGTEEEKKSLFGEYNIYPFFQKAMKYLEFNVSHKEYDTALLTLERIKQHIVKMKERQKPQPERKVRTNTWMNSFPLEHVDKE